MKILTALKKILLEENNPQSKFKILYDKHVEGTQGEKFLIDKDKNKAFEAFIKIIVGDPTSVLPEGADPDEAIRRYNSSSNKEDIIKQLDPQIKKVGENTEWLIKNYKQPGLPEELKSLDKKSPEFEAEFQKIFNYSPKQYRMFFLENLLAIAQNLEKFKKYKKYLPAELNNPENKKTYKGDLNLILNISELSNIVSDKIIPNIPEKVKEKELKKAVRSSTKGLEVPGSEIYYNGSNWVIIKISGTDGLNAARYFGGFHEVNKGETVWCTSPRSYSQYFMKYIKEAPLYVVIPGWVNDLTDRYWDQFSVNNNSPESEKKKIIEEELSKIGKSYSDVGQLTGLPSNRYQLHSPPTFVDGVKTTVQFKDRRDVDIPIFKYLSGEGLNWTELRESLRIPLAMRFQGKSVGGNTDSFELTYTGSKSLSDSTSYLTNYVKVFGFDVLMDSLGDTNSITSFIIINETNDKFSGIDFDILISKMPNLEIITLDNVIDKIPKSIYKLDNLEYLNLTRNPSVYEELSIELGNMENMDMINLKGSPNIRMPEELKDIFKKSTKNDSVYLKLH